MVAMTFVAVALVEVLGKGRVRRVHPVQYALVGLALTLFFLLLLSLSEHFAFWIAYAAASTACVAYMPVIRSTTATPTFWGPPPGWSSASPVTDIIPPMPWMMKS